jgi:23S rRNA U2552 (ribose-2'-O)-methylase RlmE/FtsJ
MGSNNLDVVSNMGAGGRPGASLRAFRDFLPNAQIYGADIDDSILFQENRIKTFPVDQLNPEALSRLGELIPDNYFDLIIDDGLHAPDANVNTLSFALGKVAPGGLDCC